MDELSSEAKKARLSELEQIVKQLEQENKQLLTKVSGGSRTDADSGDEDIIDLSQLCPASDDEWLYMSPKLTLTPVQRKHTPLQWMSEGHDRRLGDTAIPSLDEVRKALVFNMEEAETLSRAAHPPPLSTNKTAQGYLNRVRERSVSSLNRAHQNGLEDSHKSINIEDDVPVVEWKAKVPAEDPSEDDVPVVEWKAKVPAEDPSEDDVPVVKWKAKVPAEDPSEDDVPVVKWKAKVPAEDPLEDDVPVVKWKAKVPAEDPSEDDVPVVKWKAKVPAEDPSEDYVPVVKWKAKVPAEDPCEDDVPVVKWKAKMASEAPNKRSPGQARLAPRGLARPSGVRRTNSEVSPKSRREEEINTSGEFEQRSLRGPGLKQANSSSPKSLSPGAIQKAAGLRKPRTSSPGQSQLSRSRSPSPATHPQKKLLRGPVPRQNSSPVKRAGLTPPTGSGKSPQRSGGVPKRQQSVQLAKSTNASKQMPSTPKSAERLSRLDAHKQQSQATPPAAKRVSTPPMKRGLTPPGVNRTRRVLPNTPSPQRTPPPPDDDWLEGCF